MQDIVATFSKVEKNLKSKPWFKKGKWLISTHGFPSTKPEFVTFHVYKKHWFNDDKQGVHIESYLALDPKQRKKSYVTMHICHHALIPNTKIKRTALSTPFVDAIFPEVKTWKGYKFRAGKYGVQPFTKILDGTSKDFATTLEEEVAKICVQLGPAMDLAIATVLK